MLCHGLQAAAGDGAWDCRASATGGGWDCRAAAQAPPSNAPLPVPGVAQPAATPATAALPAATPSPAPATAKVAPAPAPMPSQAPATVPAATAAPATAPPVPRPEPAAASVLPAATPEPSAPPEGPLSSAPQAAVLSPREGAGKPPASPAAPVPFEPPIGAPTIPVPSSIDDGLAWAYCGPPQNGNKTAEAAAAKAPGELIEAEADSAEGRLGEEVLSLTGDVRVRQGTEVLRADRAEYDRAASVVDAQGNVLVARPDLRLTGDTAHLDMGAETGEVTAAEFRLVGTNARGTAEVANLRDKDRSDYRNVTYTTCKPGRDDWVLKARELQIDREEGLAEARNATLRLGGVPVAYLPWISFPIDNRRRSGFLFPTFGIGNARGFDVQVPYYLNLAPNYDLTLFPRYMSKRGLMLGGDFRHLSETSETRARGQILPDDKAEPDLGTRGAVSVQHRQSWGNLSANVNYNHVSDDFFLSDFGNSLTQSSTRYLARQANLAYQGDGWSLSTLVSDYQNIDPTVNPYRILPSVQFYGGHTESVAGRPVNLGVGANYTNFDRDIGVTAQRVDLYPYVTVPFRSSWGYAIPKVGLRYTTYGLDGQPAGQPNDVDRTLGIASLDSGLFLERDSEWFGVPTTQTLEPRLYYVYIPRVNQNDIPIFDTSQYDPVFDAYFLENAFTGPDRVNDANRLSLGLTTRFIRHDTGIELLRLSLGQIFFFEDRLVQLPGNAPATSSYSPTLAELGVHLDRHWSAAATGQWDVLNDSGNGNLPQQIGYRVGYRGDDGRFVRARYGRSQGVTEFTDLAFTWPVFDQVSLVGRWAYSLELEENMEALAGIEYGSCCWRVRAFARRYLKTTSVNGGQAGEQDTSFMVQLELHGLGAVGDDIEELLDRSLHGFIDHRGQGYPH